MVFLCIVGVRIYRNLLNVSSCVAISSHFLAIVCFWLILVTALFHSIKISSFHDSLALLDVFGL